MRLILWVLSLSLAGCFDNGSDRKCEPVDNQGCKAAERCAVASDGTPSCFPMGNLTEGEACDAPDACRAGLGCVQMFGVSRCLRFCAPSLDPDESACGDDETSVLRFSGQAQCVAGLPDRTDIGLCVVPCVFDPSELDLTCPSCGLVSGLPFLTCISAGPAKMGEPCGPSAQCVGNLICEPTTHTCLPTTGECGGEWLLIAGVKSPVTFDEIKVCREPL